MPRRKGENSRTTKRPIESYEHRDKERINNPPVGLVTPQTDPDVGQKKKTYAYDPHLDPQLVWAGKSEHTSFEVPTVSLHVHERIEPRTILEAVRKRNGEAARQPSLFETEDRPLREAIEFYKHKEGWTNRLIAGDSLLVMNSLLEKEGMAGKVQMIYIDPPYGIKYGSNFQPFVNKRDVKDKDEDLTAEPEQIRAFRDTWELGIHSYLTYLRDRLLLARELLTESGSIFVQISDENVHRVRCLMDEVFGAGNFISVITFKKTAGLGTETIPAVSDYLILYAKDKTRHKYRPLYREKNLEGDSAYSMIFEASGISRRMTEEECIDHSLLPMGSRVFRYQILLAAGRTESCMYPIAVYGDSFEPTAGRSWATNQDGMKKLIASGRVVRTGRTLSYVRYAEDFAVNPLPNLWTDTASGSGMKKAYVVQTNEKVIQRCLLMTTDPGDLVFDPTCVRRGTGVLTPLNPHVAPLNPPVNGGISTPSPMSGRAGVGSIPIENLCPGDWVLAHDGQPHPIVRVIRKEYRGTMIGIRHGRSSQILWMTADHRVLCQRRTQSYGANRSWRHVLEMHFARARELRRDMTPAEQRLWQHLRGEQLGVKFRKQHPVGLYIVDFYSWENGMVVEIDGDSHFMPDAQEYDRERNAYMDALGLSILRFTNDDVFKNLEGVLETIQAALKQTEPSEDHYRQWRRADSLKKGDVVYSGPQLSPVEITELIYDQTQEEVYDLEVERIEKGPDKGKYRVSVHGFDYYNTKTGQIESGGKDKIAVWLLDTDYDERSLYPCQVFFPMAAADEGWARLAKNLKAEIDEERIEVYRGTVSLPFEPGEHKRIAVKIVDDRGIESLKVLALPE